GLYYNYFRTYDPSTGRHLESDPIGVDGGLNTYLYANANPLRYVDPEGLSAGLYCGSCAPGDTTCLLYGGNLCNPGKGSFCCDSPEYDMCLTALLTAPVQCVRCARRLGKNKLACAARTKIKVDCREKHCSIKPNCGCPDGTTEKLF
ncbi:MAG TPA: RHS repeat-associated core domain-containing protein, partial [Chromatiaceae bacterium]|nr:RHS repeat-associated core domain-containing protein [Chromatiaceae bacterium]